MQTLRLLVGLPASGKSTYARTLTDSYQEQWFAVNWDTLRHFDSAGNPKEYKFTKESEQAIKEESNRQAHAAFLLGYNIVVDNTNLTEGAKNYWSEFAVRHGMQFEIKHFTTPPDECIARNDKREGWRKVPRAVIERMALWNGYVQWPVAFCTKGYPVQNVVVVDMDGTLADLSHRHRWINKECQADGCVRGFVWHDQVPPDGASLPCKTCLGTGKAKKDWNKFYETVHEDAPINGVVQWVKSLYDQGYYVCVVSGRPLDKAGVATEEWLKKHDVPFHRLFMRAAGDKRDDVIVKQEILDKMPKNQIAFSIDDRPRVVRMWRANGVKCYDVGNGVEF